MSRDISLSVVIPAYNEERRIGKTLAAVGWFLDKQNYDYEVLVVDDGSRDTTRDIVGIIAEGWPQLKMIANRANRGKGAVVKQGVLDARGRYILFADACKATPVEQFAKLLPYAREYPIVIGSRPRPGAYVPISPPPSPTL